jgi:hypothetical protein
MFGFFVNGEFKGFWSNRVGDIFADLTCLKMGWSKELTTLVYYPDLKEHELEKAVATVDKVDVYVSAQNQTGEDEEGNPIFEESQTLVKSINSDKFVVNGMMLIPC